MRARGRSAEAGAVAQSIQMMAKQADVQRQGSIFTDQCCACRQWRPLAALPRTWHLLVSQLHIARTTMYLRLYVQKKQRAFETMVMLMHRRSGVVRWSVYKLLTPPHRPPI
jgi:hypothetical protein